MRAIDWVDGAVELLDQTRLPHAEVTLRVTSVPELVDAIRRLAIRGAPALGVAGAMGVALAARMHPIPSAAFAADVAALRGARPTAVNLARGVERAAAQAHFGADAVLAEALALRDSEIAASLAIGRLGADLVQSLVTTPTRVLTICNTGTLAAVERGTALAVIVELHDRGALAEALVVETRPLLQGARLTTWELARLGVPHRLAVDAAGASLLSRGAADIVVVGADRIAANGDTVNKIGTFPLALAARYAGVAFVVAAPESTVDTATATGGDVPIEDRGPAEVVHIGPTAIAPPGTAAVNPAFDVTPAELITAIVTDQRVLRPAQGNRPDEQTAAATT